MSDGWVRLWRELIEKPIWLNSKPEHKSILITLILLANHEEKSWEWKGEAFKVYPGQMVTSIESIRKKTGKGITTQNIRSCLKRFEKLQFLTNKSTKSGRLITIMNWGTYQPNEKKATKEPTIDQQRGNKEVTPNKNVRKKECKNKEKKVPKKKLSLKTYLKEKIIEHNFIETKDKIFEFYQYRQSMVVSKRYQTEKGIDYLIRDLNGCRNNGLVVSECIDEAIGRGWQTPSPDYNYSSKTKPVNGYSRMDQNKAACKDFINSFEE